MPINPFSCFEGFASLKANVTIDPDTCKSTVDVQVGWSYPHTPSEFMATFKGADKMAFPYLSAGEISSIVPRGDGTFIFVLTRETEKTSRGAVAGGAAEQGVIKQLYGHCLGTVNGEAFVILSPYPWADFFRTLLLYYKGNGATAGQALLIDLYKAATPNEPGGSFGLRFGGSVLKRPLDVSHMRGVDADPLLLLRVFTDAQLCQLVSAMLLIETIIVCGPDFGVVSKVIVALRALIAPIDPQCWVYAPVLPKEMIDYVASPVPGIFGITDNCFTAATKACESLGSAVFVQLASTFSTTTTVVQSGGSTSHSPFADSPSSSRISPAEEARRQKKYRKRNPFVEDNPPFDGSVWCANVAFLNTEHMPLPRTSSIFSSTLRRGLAAMRSSQKQGRKAEDLLMLFARYFAVHLGHVGAPSFTPAMGLTHHRQANRKRSDVEDEIRFLAKFYESQCCVELAQYLQRTICASTEWTADPFSNMVVQLNPTWFGTELAKYRKDQLPPVATRSSWGIFMEASAKGASLLCCDRSGDVISDDEQGPSRTTSSNNTNANNSSGSQGPGGLYLTPNGDVAASRETIICREDVELRVLDSLPLPGTGREYDDGGGVEGEKQAAGNHFSRI